MLDDQLTLMSPCHAASHYSALETKCLINKLKSSKKSQLFHSDADWTVSHTLGWSLRDFIAMSEKQNEPQRNRLQ